MRHFIGRWAALFCALLGLLLVMPLAAAEAQIVTLESETTRVELLSDAVIRVEEKGEHGFEDRVSLIAAGRGDFTGVAAKTRTEGNCLVAETAAYTVKLYTDRGYHADAVEIFNADGRPVWTVSKTATQEVRTAGFYHDLPDPGDTPEVYALLDYPRILPAEKGAAYVGSTDAYSGWERYDATDVYVMFAYGDAATLRTRFAEVTGRTPISDIKTFGSWYSRYQNWTDADYKAVVENYRANGFPLDILVIDTKWRAGKDGTGYDIDTKNFPDMEGFVDWAHKNGVMLLFNDHTHKTDKQALDPEELKYHTENLTNILKLGVDGWWYDRNWGYTLHSPYADSITFTTFGEILYNDILASYSSTKRPFLLSNADWVRHGHVENAPSVIGHRYGIQWTGDITSEAMQLRREIENMVSKTTAGASPYLSSDLGGFKRAKEQSEAMYTRWMQYGALSPIFRIHSTMESGGAKYDKLPYTYSAATQAIVKKYMNLRYNLLPLFYTLGHEAYETGMPITRRTDFYDDSAAAKDNTQYLLGRDLLVAPLWSAYGEGDGVVPASWFGEAGLTALYYNSRTDHSKAVYQTTVPNIELNWGTKSPDASVRVNLFSGIFEGKITPAFDCYLGGAADDGMRVYINGELLVDAWKSSWLASAVNTETLLRAGVTYDIRVEYYDGTSTASCYLLYELPSEKNVSARDVYLPAGGWTDVFTGTHYAGGGTVRVCNGIETTPLFARDGAVLPAVKVVSPIEAADFPALSLNVFDGGDGSYTLYEDDGETVDYRTGDVRKTLFTHTETGARGSLAIAKAEGAFTTDYTARTYTVRIHSEKTIENVKLDGRTVEVTRLAKDAAAAPLAETGAAPDGTVYEMTFTAPMNAAHTLTWEMAASGDLDGDGAVTVRDVLLAARAALNGTYTADGDLNTDGKITAEDVTRLLARIF